jgi:hypothetical protein
MPFTLNQETHIMSTITAEENLARAHDAVYDLASRISDYIADYEGTGATMSFADIASGVGINLRSLKATDLYLFYIAAEAATDFRQWVKVNAEGAPTRFTKRSRVTEFRKPEVSPSARKRARG